MVEESAPELDAAALGAFRDVFEGEMVLPAEEGFDAARAVWNGMIDRRPAIVVRPANVDGVIASVRFARDRGLLIAVRGGGHSIPGFSTCDGGIVIDLSRMRGVRVDPEARVARVNGGALLAELDQEAQVHGLACPVGVVAETGVAGLTLGGGMGRLQRKFGLTVDNLLSVDLVTADGRLVHASEQENAELFWGLRGAGANFGIVTTFEFRLHPVGPTVTNGFVLHPIERATELADLFREFVETTPDEVMTTFGFGLAIPEHEFPPEVAGRPVVWISAHHCGPPEAADRDLVRVRAFGAPIVDTFAPVPYLAAQHANDDAMAWGHRFYMKSGYTTSLPNEMVDRCVERMAEVSDAAADPSLSIWAWGRAIGRVPEDAMAYTGRDAAFWASAEVLWDDPNQDEPNIEWGRRSMAAIEPFTVSGRYVNDVVESGDDVVRSIYGETKYQRLTGLKRVWDPDNVFRLNQNVRP